MSIDYKAFFIEALKITFFCLLVTALFKFFDASNNTLLMVFNMAVMFTAATLTHLYWIGLTTLLVIQGSQQKTIQTSFKRIGVNAIGALIAVLLFSYIIPPIFWINFAVLTLFLFLIFALGFSYIGRVLFIELFVLGFTHLLGDYQAFIALDRVILTFIGSSIVIFASLMIYFGDLLFP